MNDIEKYHFDLNGYLLVKNLLNAQEVAECLTAANKLEEYIAENIDREPQTIGYANISYRFDDKYQCFSYKNQSGGGLQIIVDDFLNASSAFDVVVGHEPTMSYVRELCAGPHWIGSSELRYRYQSNETHTHMGGRMDTRNRYEFVGVKMFDSSAQTWSVRDFNLNAVRVLYALHDIPIEHGPLCVVPGSHKANYFSPFAAEHPTTEPGMVPIPMSAGDAIIFTENLRHGGFPNLLGRPRTTLHLMFSPRWAGSQSPIHWNDKVYVSKEAWARYSKAQQALLPPPVGEFEKQVKALRHANEKLTASNEELRANNERLKSENERLNAQQGASVASRKPKRSVVSVLRRVIGA